MISAQIRKKYKDSKRRPLNYLEVIEDDHSVTITGELESFYLLQIAQSLAMEVCDGKRIMSNVLVKEPKLS